ncbi:MAG TPA: ABC transporter permease [Gemmatimonadales bacterium]
MSDLRSLIPTALAGDLRFAGRTLWKHPGFASLAVLTIALAIGATTAIFSVVNGVLLAPLPFPQADRLVRIYEQNSPTNKFPLSVADYQAVVERQRTFDHVAALRYANATLTGAREPEVLRAGYVSANWFATWGIVPARGRGFRPGEDGPGGERVAIVSRSFGVRRWGENADPVGRSLLLDGTSYTVVGMLPAGLETFGDWSADVWPILQVDAPSRRGPFLLRVVGRLAPGTAMEAAAVDLARVSEELFPAWSSTFSDAEARLTPYGLKAEVIGDVGRPLVLLLGAVAFLLLIAVANVANLLLARASARGGEMAIRTSLGATRGALVRQLLVESVVLAVIGGVLGVALAYVALDALVALGPNLPRLGDVRLDSTVLAFAAAVTLASGLLFGLAPMMHALRAQPAAALAGSRGGSSGKAANRFRGALVSIEFALAVPLLAGAALLFTSLGRLQRVDAGFDPDDLLLARVSLPAASYPDGAAVSRFWDLALPRIAAIPGVETAAITSGLPPDEPNMITNFDLIDKPVPPGTSEPVAPWLAVTPTFFGTMGIRLVQGRLLDRTDTEDGPPVVVVSRSWANRYYPDESPIGKRLYEGGDRSDPSTIVGVVSDVKYSGLAREEADAVYVPHRWFAVRSVNLVVRTAGAAATVGDISREFRTIDADLPLTNVRTMRDKLAGAVTRPKYWTTLVTVFALLGVVLAAVGVYGVLSYFVTGQTREIGIRIALGADASSVRRLVLRRGMGQAATGLSAGLLMALWVTRGLESLLFEVSATDPATFGAVAVALLAVALTACYLPARRATRIDPARVLVEQ